jgi:hypothetical protein
MFENMWYSFMVILLLSNGLFVAISFLPADQAGTRTLGDVWGTDIVTDMNGTINIFGNQINVGTNFSTDTNTEATTGTSDKVDIFKTFLFGIGSAIGAAATLINFMGQVLFGYMLWLDMLLNPAWHPMVAALNGVLKIVLFLIEVVGLISFTKGFFIFRNLF